jgi:hypothetical protein
MSIWAKMKWMRVFFCAHGAGLITRNMREAAVM